MKKFQLLQGKEVIGIFECQKIESAIQYFSIIKRLKPELLLKVFKVKEDEF
jgi:hypothetical protein